MKDRRVRDQELAKHGHIPTTVRPVRDSRPWRDSRGTPWEFELEWASLSGGRIECVGVTMRSKAGPQTRALTASVLREVPIGALIAEGRRDLIDYLKTIASSPRLEKRARRSLGRLGAGGRSHQGVALTPEILQEVANVYRDADERGTPPVVAVKDHFKIALGTARKRVAKARLEGFLGPAIPGQSGEKRSSRRKSQGRKAK